MYKERLNRSIMTSYKEFKKEIFESNPEVKKEYDSLKTQNVVINVFQKHMEDNNMTQTDLGNLLGIKQQNVSRFLRGDIDVSLKWATKCLNKLGYTLIIVPFDKEK